MICSRLRLALVLIVALGAAALTGSGTAEAQITGSQAMASVDAAPDGLHFSPDAAALPWPVAGWTLTVGGPDGFYQRQSFDANAAPALFVAGLVDGEYTWRLQANPQLDPQIRAQLESARAGGDQEALQRLIDLGRLPAPAPAQGGAFQVRDGIILDPFLAESGAALAEDSRQTAETGAHSVQAPALTNATEAYYVGNNLYVNNSACIGGSCPTSGLSFGYDTIRLIENNLRIHFDDDSIGSFPDRDWRLVVNDSSSGGRDRFSIEDATLNREIFTVKGGALPYSLYVDNGGKVGFGTSQPSVDLHVETGDTPELRLEQNVSSGFAEQAWDLAGNETSFFVRDATNGSTLPFRIRPGADTNSLVVGSNSNVGIGILNPDANVRLQVQADTSSNFGGLRVENSGSGNIQTQFANTNGGWEWRQTFRSGDMIFDSQEDGANEWEVDTGGNVTATSFNPTSDRNLKQGFEAVDPEQILERLAAIPVTQWSYRGDAAGTQHIGPVAQDFHAAFGVGADDRHISTTDADGVAFAAIQALYQRLMEKEAEIDTLKEQVRLLLELQRADGATALEP
ncbi:MAG: tail fiber domain-containing protein [Acidobacteriota bacterium]|nr:tail fiber domain-containing protein [Acidobacteriota bacterium]